MSIKVKIFSFYFAIEELLHMSIREAENWAIERALTMTGRDAARAAAILGIGLDELMRRLGGL